MLRDPDEIRICREDILALRKAGNSFNADRAEKYLAAEMMPRDYQLVLSRPGDSRDDTPNYPFRKENVMIATPERIPFFLNKKGYILKGAPVMIWERESLSWRSIPAGQGSSNPQVAAETSKKLDLSMYKHLEGF